MPRGVSATPGACAGRIVAQWGHAMRESTCVEVSSHVQRTSLCQYFPYRVVQIPDSLGPNELVAGGGSMAGLNVASRSSGRLPHTQPNVNAVQVRKDNR